MSASQVESIEQCLNRCDGIFKEIYQKSDEIKIKLKDSQKKLLKGQNGNNDCSVKKGKKKSHKKLVRKFSVANVKLNNLAGKEAQYKSTAKVQRLAASTPIKKSKVTQPFQVNSSQESIINLLKNDYPYADHNTTRNSLDSTLKHSDNMQKESLLPSGGDDKHNNEGEGNGVASKMLDAFTSKILNKHEGSSLIAETGKSVVNKDESVNLLEAHVIKQQNSILRTEIDKLARQLLIAKKSCQDQLTLNENLQKEIVKMKDELRSKDEQISRAHETLQLEREHMKKECELVIDKFDLASKLMGQSEQENKKLKFQMKLKCDENGKLTEVNRHLQSSVTRLLNDLQANNNDKHEMTSKLSEVMMKRLDQLIASPPPPLVVQEDNDSRIRTLYRADVEAIDSGTTVVTSEESDDDDEDDESFHPLDDDEDGGSCSSDAVSDEAGWSVEDDLSSITSSCLRVQERNLTDELTTIDENIEKLQRSLMTMRQQND